MVRLRVLDILAERGRKKYWLFSQMDMSYQNFNKMVNNETKGIRYETLSLLCEILEVEPGQLFEFKTDIK